MSVIACHRSEGAIIIASDGVAYNNDGVILHHIAKVLPIVEFNCVVASTGAGGFGANIRDRLAISASDFDDLLEKTEEEMRAVQIFMSLAEQEAPINATVLLAGWSEKRQRLETYKMHTRRRSMENSDTGELTFAEPWLLHPVPELWSSHGIDFKTLCGVLGTDTMGSFDAVAGMVCLSRQMSGQKSDDPAFDGVPYAAGGFLQMTLVERRKITSWIAHRWPTDEIGKVLDPLLGEAMPVFPITIPD